MRARGLLPLALAGLALLAVVALPAAAYAMTPVGRPGDFASALRAHVAWARFLALALAIGAAVALAREARADPRRAAWQAAGLALGCAIVGLAAAAPFYDQWLDARTQARYAGADGWAADRSMHVDGPEERAYGYHWRDEAATGTFTTSFPRLAKGDEYWAWVGLQVDDPGAYWESQVSLTPHGPCDSFDSQTPPPPRAGDARTSVLWVHQCTAREGAAPQLVARWGDPDVPVGASLGGLVRPTYTMVVLARADTSLLFAAVAVGVSTQLAYALATRRSAASPVGAVALSAAPMLVCGLWALAALWPRPGAFPAPSAPATASFALLALAAAGVGAVALGRALRGRLAPARAARAAAFAAAALATLAPIAALRVWPGDVPWVVLGMMGTFLLAGVALVGSREPPRCASDAAPAPAP